MLLIHFVSMGMAQRQMIRIKTSEGMLLIQAIEQTLQSSEGDAPGPQGHFLEALINKSDYTCAVVFNPDLSRRLAIGQTEVPPEEITRATERALASGEPRIEFTGQTWGLLWRQHAAIVQSSPLYRRGNLAAGVAVIFPLQEIYRQLRYSQMVVFIYMLINLVFLCFIGRHRISKFTILPLKKLLETARANTEGRETFFLGGEKDGNEFNQLSHALNQMLQRISRDQENLQRNVHSLKQANRELKKAQKDIINAEKLASVGRLSAGIAHEIGNPLSIIVGYLELLKRKDISFQEREEFLARTEREINRIHQIIRQLLDFSRPSSNSSGKVFVHDILSEVGAIFQYQPLMRHIDLTFSFKAIEDGVRADGSLLRQAFINLTINAADAIHQTDRQGSLIVETRNTMTDHSNGPDPEIEITFTDNGIGIPQDHLDLIFEPFFTTKAPGKGTGLGLSVCYMIVEAAGGKIKAYSEECMGSTITITLPLWNGASVSDG